MNQSIKRIGVSLLGIAMLTASCQGKEGYQFSPRLSSQEQITLNVAGFFGNFEALDAVTNAFSDVYPNVQFDYQQVGGAQLLPFLKENANNDIFMTSSDLVSNPEFLDKCLNLNEADVNLSDVSDKMLKGCTSGDKLYSLPIGQNVYGIITNVALLKKEGLEVPSTLSEFENCLSVLKGKGYTPIQGPESKVYAELTYNWMCAELLEDQKDGTVSKECFEPIFDKIQDYIDKGYISHEVNALYPYDNYNDAILRFFDGEVPFWVCNSEKVSGMKKRESKSDKFKLSPFEYTYIYAPMGEKGVYAYTEPWVGFAVNKDSKRLDYAKEFLRFFAGRERLDMMAETKGIPTASVSGTADKRYEHIIHPQKVQEDIVQDGTFFSSDNAAWYECVNNFASGKLTKEQALSSLVEKINSAHQK